MISEILIGSTVLLAGYGFYKYENQSIEKAEYVIENEKISKEFEDFKIVQISDLHNVEFGNKNYKLIKCIDELNPDIIVITGDLVDGERANFEVALDLIDELLKKYKVYHILGNHEEKALLKKYREKYKNYFSQLYNKNIINLENEHVEIVRGKSSINLYGLVVPLSCYRYLFSQNEKTTIDKKYIQNKLGDIEKDKFNILLSHTPFYFNEYSDWGADLVLAGHVHGGIIRLPFLGGLLSPNREFFPKYDLGEYKINNSSMILSKGLGGSKILPRVNCRPEVVKITLKNKIKI